MLLQPQELLGCPTFSVPQCALIWLFKVVQLDSERECKAGSVQAIRLLLEWAGKLNKTLDINISSPFEKWLTANGKKIERPDNAEDGVIIYDELPERTADNSRQAAEEGIVRLDKELIKKKTWLARRRELYSWHRRAAVVGIATLPPKKVSKGTRLAWEESIIQAERG